jgi:hypothetical protein
MFKNNQIDDLKDYPSGAYKEFFNNTLDELLAKINRNN